jgi:cap2 methyltransferase
MLVYDISSSGKIPAISNWLSPNYQGPEDILSDATTPREKINYPNDWKTDFPDYVYEYPELLAIKQKLNATKRRIDPITNNPRLREKYDKLVDMTRAHDALRGKGGVLVKEYGAEIVTNAWLKMYEMMPFLHPMLSKLQKTKGSKQFHSFHIAEAPGNFMLAINHKLKTEYSSVEWEWLANSYRELYASRASRENESGYLPDQYGLIAQYPDRWVFGADCDGDITSPANIISFAQTIRSSPYMNGLLQFITSDVKYVPQDVNFDEEERINLPVHLGHMICSLVALSKGGTMILKQFTLFEGPSIAMLYLMACCFKQLRIVKPETSRPGNSEIYVVGVDYKKNLSTLQIDKLMNIMNYVRFLNTESGSPSIFQKADIPISFVEKIMKIETQLAKIQIMHIDRNLKLLEEYQDSPYSRVQRDLAPIREKAAATWIEKNKAKMLDPRHHISRRQGGGGVVRSLSKPYSRNANIV